MEQGLKSLSAHEIEESRLTTKLLPFALAFALAACAAEPVHVTAERLSSNPLLRPGGQPWNELGLFNPTAIKMGEKTVLLFRAQDKQQTSRIGYAESSDGLHFTVRPEPVLSPETHYEKGGGLEDPRVVRINGIYYLTYTGYNLHDAQLCLATSTDLIHWQRRGVILPAYHGTWNMKWTKSGAIVPEKINGKWWMYYLGTRTDADGKDRDYMGLASSDDLLHWADATDKPVLDRRAGAFDSRVMEPGPAPFLTGAGILLLYNGADDNLVYGPGWVLFDLNDPRRVLARADHPFILPALEWEKVGNVPNVIFLEGAVQVSSAHDSVELTGYYGGADKYVGGMRIHVTSAVDSRSAKPKQIPFAENWNAR
ncbi:MAG: family 43 glycosylhydrolase [Acidobacteriaceae bacterium]|nr:family 43 glycosylhydrolase [Acidobacteriaceae bacterium]